MHQKPSDVRIEGAALHLLPIRTRMPLKFGTETLTSATCARVAVAVVDRRGRRAVGWGETPLSVQWVWPSSSAYPPRLNALIEFSTRLARAWVGTEETADPMTLGWHLQETVLRREWGLMNSERQSAGLEPMPWLAALVCASAFDLALHDAAASAAQVPVFALYTPEFMNHDLSWFLEDAHGGRERFRDRHPTDYLRSQPRLQLPAWHLVGGLDPLDDGDLNGTEPRDGYPVTLVDWIRTDGLRCLKVKLRGTDPEWDYQRLVRVGRLAIPLGVEWLTADFNCTVTDPAVVNLTLDRLRDEHPRIYGMMLYVEQPFPYELEHLRIDVHSVSARKPLFLDESAHDWRQVRLGRELGWNGVALKTCKTQTGAVLSACWAESHGMGLMVQDLTNPMLAQITHLTLASHVPTIMGVETNSMQFYPEASAPEAKVHPGIYRRRGGMVDLGSIGRVGFGYRTDEIQRALPPAAVAVGTLA